MPAVTAKFRVCNELRVFKLEPAFVRFLTVLNMGSNAEPSRTDGRRALRRSISAGLTS